MTKRQNDKLLLRINSLRIRLDLLRTREDAQLAFESPELWREEIQLTERHLHELESQLGTVQMVKESPAAALIES